jgi:uncharacterized OB-fold protein
MSATPQILDWTTGAQGIAYQDCSACKAVWYFRRTFCPHCGSAAPAEKQASGLGTVHAATQVTRAPSEELRPYAPYVILLVDADEGFRLMAHGDTALKIGDRVRARFTTLAGKLIPHFEKVQA